MRNDLGAVVPGVLDEDAVRPAAGLEGAGDVQPGNVGLAGLGIVGGDQSLRIDVNTAAALEVGVRLVAEEHVGGLSRQHSEAGRGLDLDSAFREEGTDEGVEMGRDGAFLDAILDVRLEPVFDAGPY